MKITILYNLPLPQASSAEEDVLVQVESVRNVLVAAGHQCLEFGCTLDLGLLRSYLLDTKPDCVFNLVESLAGTDRLSALVPILLDAMSVSYTGSSAVTMMDLTDKVAVKQKLRALNLPTPDWYADGCNKDLAYMGKYILKPRFEHASVGIGDDSIIEVENVHDLVSALDSSTQATGLSMFAERFIPDREFNIAVLATDTNEPLVLNPAEIDFSAFQKDKPKIVGYSAKWEESSFEYQETPRRFHFPVEDAPLIKRLQEITLQCWHKFSLGGYARVDFRVDDQGNPYVLEINTNPCLSPDAGFSAAVEQSGYDFATAICSILSSVTILPSLSPAA